MNKFLKDYGLSVTLFFLFIVSWYIQTWAGWHEFISEQSEHGQTAQIWGPSGYFWVWLRATFENWQSEFLQLLTFVYLTSILIHKGSAESRDGEDEIKATLARIEKRLGHVEKSR